MQHRHKFYAFLLAHSLRKIHKQLFCFLVRAVVCQCIEVLLLCRLQKCRICAPRCRRGCAACQVNACRRGQPACAAKFHKRIFPQILNPCHRLCIYYLRIQIRFHIPAVAFVHVFRNLDADVVPSFPRIFRCHCQPVLRHPRLLAAIQSVKLHFLRVRKQLTQILHFLAQVGVAEKLSAIRSALCRRNVRHAFPAPVQLHPDADHASFAQTAHGSWSGNKIDVCPGQNLVLCHKCTAA